MNEEASLLSRKYTSTDGAFYVANCVILPRVLYKLKFTPASCEEIDNIQRSILRMLVKKCKLGGRRAADDILFGG